MADKVKLLQVCPEVFGITEQRYRQLAANGVVPPVRKGEIEFLEAVKALLQYYRKLAEGQGSFTLTEERARLTKITADWKELLLRKKREELVEVEVISKMATDIFIKLAARLHTFPAKVAPLVLGCKSVQEAHGVLERLMAETLSELSKLEYYFGDKDK